MEPTFQTSRGSSSVDLTMSRNINVQEWRIGHETILSGHRYIFYELDIYDSIKQDRIIYDYGGMDWEVFKQRLEGAKQNINNMEIDLSKRAEYLQGNMQELEK